MMKYPSILFLIAVFLIPNKLAGADHPNVLFIAVDDLNNWISCLKGHPQANTPNIDQLVNRGMLFTHCYCAAPACNPSRVALMTGQQPASTGVYHNPQPFRPVYPEIVTLPQYFRQHGYYALGSGKIYHSSGVYTDPNSWDEYAPGLTKQTFPSSYPKASNLNQLKKSHFDWGPVNGSDADMADSKTVDYVCAQLKKEWSQPFFLACGIFRPHLPWHVPQEYFDEYPLQDIRRPIVIENDLDDIPSAGIAMAKPQGDHHDVTKSNQWDRAVQGYLASISFTDRMVGRVLEAYNQSPERDNTIIVFWTDHGWHLGEKQHWRKFALWEDATQVPMAIIAPGLTVKNSRCTTPVNLVDLYPTLVDLCGLPTKSGLDGLSLKPLLQNPNSKWERPSLTTHGKNNHALRSQRWRYIRYADGSEELYDHENDPHEWHNLAHLSEHDDVKQELSQYFPEVNADDIPKDAAKQRRNPKNKK